VTFALSLFSLFARVELADLSKLLPLLLLLQDELMLACTTQNGYVVLWKVNASPSEGTTTSPNDKQPEKGRGHNWLERRWKGKLHLGSIEGLAWKDHAPDGPSLATVGGDCIVNMFKYVHN